MNERNKYLLFWAVFLSLVSLSIWYFYPMSGWGWVEWVSFVYLAGAYFLIGLFVSEKVGRILFERRLKEEQKKTKALILEIRAKKK